MNHHHLIYTPKGLKELSEGALSYASKYAVFAELGAGGLHFHCYIVTDYHDDKVTTELKKVQEIPTGMRGKKSIHFSHRYVAPTHKDFPNTDFQKFTLGYCACEEQLKFIKGFTSEEIKESVEYYFSLKPKKLETPVCAQKPAEDSPATNDDSIQGKWLDYSVELMKGITPLTEGLSYDYFRKKSWNYWKKKNNGLFPQMSTQKRFLQSIWAQYLDLNKLPLDLELTKEFLSY